MFFIDKEMLMDWRFISYPFASIILLIILSMISGLVF